MGSVYRALDRLTNQMVALKFGKLGTSRSDTDSWAKQATARMSLMREFQTLTQLNHPHIVSVLDFGFDDQLRPFFTMVLHEHARDVLTAARQTDSAGKIQYLIETLQALAYLHRHHVIHRDLKPSNILIDESGQVRVVDFGLATPQGMASGLDGTLAYLAPEVLETFSVSPASDLYALGIVAYELFAGVHPFAKLSIGQLLQAKVRRTPDLSLVQAPDGVRTVIERLLQRHPTARYASAEAVISALCAAVDHPAPAFSATLGEHYWQSARFTGRERELTQLTTALDTMLNGHGSALVFMSASGTGKSRLLDELRVSAVTRGALVLRGGGVEDGGLPYALWRGIVRELLLLTQVTGGQAAVLKALVPDIDDLLGRPIPSAPPLSADAEQERLIFTLLQVFRQQTKPLVLLLDDLQWAAESQIALTRICELAPHQRLLIVGAYRTDDPAWSPTMFSKLQVIPLRPFSVTETQLISESIIGDLSPRPHLVKFLVDHTEGNAFFLIETLRTLAAAADSLEAIGAAELPNEIVPQSVLNVAQQRRNRLPAAYQPALSSAALLGRDLDLALLATLAPALDLEDWLLRAEDVGLIQFEQGRWRFTHDMMRAGISAALTADERPTLHRRCALAIEALYGHRSESAARLAQHWKAAGDLLKELHYTLNAAQQWLRLSDFQTAREQLVSLLERVGDNPRLLRERSTLHALIAETYQKTVGYQQAHAHYGASLALATQTGDASMQAEAQLGLGQMLIVLGLAREAEAPIRRALAAYQAGEDRSKLAKAIFALGELYLLNRDYPNARRQFQASLDTLATVPDPEFYARILTRLSNIANTCKEYETAENLAQTAYTTFREIGNRFEMGNALTALFLAAICQDKDEAAEAHARENLQICTEINHLRGVVTIQINLGYFAFIRGHAAESITHYTQAAIASEVIGLADKACSAWSSLLQIHALLAQWEEARSSGQAWLRTTQALTSGRANLHGLYGLIRLAIHDQRIETAAHWLGALDQHGVPEDRDEEALLHLHQQIGQLLTAETLRAALADGASWTISELMDNLQAYFDAADQARTPVAST